MKKAFALLDKDGDQLISREDLMAAMTEAGVAFSEDILDIFQQLDRDGDECITFDEFSIFWETHVKEEPVMEEWHEKAVFTRSNSTKVSSSGGIGHMMSEDKDYDKVLKKMRGSHFVTAISRRNRLSSLRIYEQSRKKMIFSIV